MINIKRTDEQLKLLQAMASTNPNEAFEAQSLAAEYMEPTLQTVVNTAATLSAIYEALDFEENDAPSLPLELYHDITATDEIRVVMQHNAGGLATNMVVPSVRDLYFSMFPLESAYAFDKKHARNNRLNLLALTFTRMAQEFLQKREKAAANNLLQTLALAAAEDTSHMITSNAVNHLMPDDFNSLITRSKRVNESWTDGTPVNGARGVTDLILSPERMEDLRSMAYNPINVKGANGTTGTASSGVVAAPESVRAGLFSAAGLPSFYGLNLMEIYELGPNEKYTNIFQALASAQSVTFNAGDDIVLGIDRNRGGAYAARRINGRGNQITIAPDDQFVNRQKKIGFYSETEDGMMVTDRRFLTAIRVKSS